MPGAFDAKARAGYILYDNFLFDPFTTTSARPRKLGLRPQTPETELHSVALGCKQCAFALRDAALATNDL